MAAAAAANVWPSCPMCYNDYHMSDPKRMPKVLPCGHSICAGCVAQMHSKRGMKIVCPKDSREHVVADPQEDLPTNMMVMEMMESMGREANVGAIGAEKGKEKDDDDDVVMCKDHDKVGVCDGRVSIV